MRPSRLLLAFALVAATALGTTTATAAPGLRLLLGSSDSPHHEPLASPGRNLVFHDAKHPARLKLGVR